MRFWFRSSLRVEEQEGAASTGDHEEAAIAAVLGGEPYCGRKKGKNSEEVPVNWDGLPPDITITPEPPKPSVRAEITVGHGSIG